MGRKKSARTPPNWAYEDNPFSTFGMIYADMLKSPKYQALSCSAKQFLTVCIVQSNTKESQECLFNALKERYESLGEPKSDFDLNVMVHDHIQGLFVFPKVQYEKFGYGSKYTFKCFQALKDAGFITVFQEGKTNRNVNIYQFSTKWKK